MENKRTPTRWRLGLFSVATCLLLLISTLSIAQAKGATYTGGATTASSAPRVYAPIKATGKLAGITDLSKAPRLIPSDQTSAQAIALPHDPLTPAQRAAAIATEKANPQVKNPHPNTRSGDGKSPAFVGGGVTPLVTKNVDGLTSVQAGSPGAYPDPAIATDLSYVMEGVENAVAIYRASTGALVYGPYAASSFFAPVYTSGDTFNNTQMYYDVMRDRWVVSMLQDHAGASYIDLAISTSTSPTQPSPGGQYYIYQIGTNFEPNGSTPSFCPRMTMGMDYWGVYFTCANYLATSDFVGNTMLALAKAPLLSGGSWFGYYANDGLRTGARAPAYAVSPAIEEGVQDAEFFVSTDAGLLGANSSSNMGLCAWTNLSNITTTTPTVTCQNVNLGLAYDDPLPAFQPSDTVVQVSFGPRQVYYKAGRLYLAQSILVNGKEDSIYWAEVQPQLTTKAAHNPQWVNSAVVTQVSYFDFGSGTDLYEPMLMGMDENDISLVYNISSGGLNPSIEMTGRKATDAPSTLGQGGGSVVIVAGTHPTGYDWSEYSSCAIALNSVTRGTVWCAAEYMGSVTDIAGWNTRLFSFRTE
jgi:hypothetical protein